MRVLVVDDNVDSAALLEILLSEDGHEVRMAHDGHQAIETVGLFRPEVMFLDIGLPGMSGHEVARKLRETHPKGTLTIVALTGFGHDEERKRSAESGMDHHVLKPLDLDELQTMLRKYTAGSANPG